MIKGVLIINNHGKARLLKFYDRLSYDKQQSLVGEVYRIVSKRSDDLCNFAEAVDWPGKDTRYIYRHYATLYFVFVVDGSESELAILDLVQVFVEVLDRYFEEVCEVDLIFHSDKVHYILDEIIMGGMVLETSKDEIMRSLNGHDQKDKTKNK
ncbi:AP-3 complex subunit sigma [Diplonema papillatum]|nr:AP-3 complex subunit sigma [Diplonema papillatum]